MPNSLLIDTNLLLLLIVGATEKSAITQHKRTREYVVEDYDLLLTILNDFHEVWVTSHCLGEVSNLLRQTNPFMAEKLMMSLRKFCALARESHIPKSQVFQNQHVNRFGVSDTGFIEKSKRVSHSITTDFDLYLEILQLGRKIINFNHVRTNGWK